MIELLLRQRFPRVGIGNAKSQVSKKCGNTGFTDRGRAKEKEVNSMISQIGNNGIILLKEIRESVPKPKTAEEKKPAETVVSPKVEKEADKTKECLRDEVGCCDNLTASYWG